MAPGPANRHESVRGPRAIWCPADARAAPTFVGSSVDKLPGREAVRGGHPGVYRQVHQLVLVPIEQLNAPIANVAQPGLSLLQDDPDRYRRYYGKVVAVSAS